MVRPTIRKPQLHPAVSVRLLELPAAGKAVALNHGVASAGGEILVFADARQQFSPDAITALVENFDDPEVGCVTGDLMLDCETDRQARRARRRRGRGPLLALRKVVTAGRERHLVDAWRDRGHLRASPLDVAAAPRRHAAR